MHTKFEDITLFGLQTQFESNQKIIAKIKLSLSPKTECIIPGLVAENRKFRFGIIDYPDPDNTKEGVLIASPVVDLSKSSHPNRKCNSQDHSSDDLVKNLLQNIDLDKKQRCSAGDLITEFQSVFSRTSEDFGRTRLTKHRIDTGEHPPTKKHPRRLPFAKQEEVRKLIKDMKNNVVIEMSSSPWASPISWSGRKMAHPDSVWTIVDLKSGYWQVELHPDDKEKTAFTTGQGLWQFKLMPFGLCNDPQLSSALWKQTSENIRRVLQKLKEANLKLSPSKGHLFRREVTYLGHIISAEGVRTDPDKISFVKDCNCPTDVHQLRSFLGLCTYYRKFVKNFSTIDRPLHKLTEAKQKFIWTVDCNNAFNKLKDALTSALILAYPEIGKQFILDTNASHESTGAVLTQEIDGQERVIAYFSKCLSKPERNYCVTRKELLAIVKAVEHFHPYLYRSAHGNADVLSKRPCPEICKYCSRIEKNFGVIGPIVRQVTTPSTSALDLWSDESVRKDQLADPEIKPIIEFKESSDEKPSWQVIASFHPTTKRYWALWDSLHLRNGVLYQKWESDDGKTFRWQLILPKTRVSRVLKELHVSLTGGHFGAMKTLQKVRPLPRSSDGKNNNILVVRVYFTKWPEAYPIPDQKASTVAEVLVQHWISRFGVPLQLHSDQGRNFDSAVCKRLCEILAIDKTRTTALHPQSDGMIERSAVHETTGYFPSQMLFGRDLRLPEDFLFSRPPDVPLAPEEYIEKLQARMRFLKCSCKQRQEKKSPNMGSYANLNPCDVHYLPLKTATAGSDVVQSGRPIFDYFFQHLWPYIGNNTANVVFQMIKRLWLIRIDQ
ncbi:retrovirus-related Pol polyprotein from transposon opus [Trichonephila clavipes]|nr:retrovirus-related Pol polyprotein from transposon opus [Trichonephila clavipes]